MFGRKKEKLIGTPYTVFFANDEPKEKLPSAVGAMLREWFDDSSGGSAGLASAVEGMSHGDKVKVELWNAKPWENPNSNVVDYCVLSREEEDGKWSAATPSTQYDRLFGNVVKPLIKPEEGLSDVQVVARLMEWAGGRWIRVKF